MSEQISENMLYDSIKRNDRRITELEKLAREESITMSRLVEQQQQMQVAIRDISHDLKNLKLSMKILEDDFVARRALNETYSGEIKALKDAVKLLTDEYVTRQAQSDISSIPMSNILQRALKWFGAVAIVSFALGIVVHDGRLLETMWKVASG